MNARILCLVGIALALGLAWIASGDESLSAQSTEESATVGVFGERDGRVLVKNQEGETLREFAMGPGVVRETYLLNDASVVAASQLNRTIFWNLEKGHELTRVDHRIYAFNPDGQSYLGGTFTKDVRELAIYRYPGNRELWKLTGVPTYGPAKVLFSPDGRHLFLRLHNNYPVSDRIYPNAPPTIRSDEVNVLFDLRNQRLVSSFSHTAVVKEVKFSPDSRYLTVNSKRFDVLEEKWPETTGGN